MNKQTVAVVVAAVAVFVGGVVGALAFTGDDSGTGNVHTMPGGGMMTGMMTGPMMGHMTPGGGTMTGPMHTMPGGGQMPGMTHSP